MLDYFFGMRLDFVFFEFFGNATRGWIHFIFGGETAIIIFFGVDIFTSWRIAFFLWLSSTRRNAFFGRGFLYFLGGHGIYYQLYFDYNW
jgi:hypothetical protein